MLKLSRFPLLASLSIPTLIVACSAGVGGGGGQTTGDGASGGTGSMSTGGAVAAGGAVSSAGSGTIPVGAAGTPAGGAAAGGAPNGAGAAGQNAGGTLGAGGKPAAAGAGGTVGAAGSAGAPPTTAFGPAASCKAWPAATGTTQTLTKTMSVATSFDGKLQKFVGSGLGDGGQAEGQSPLFELANGATIQNVIIGAPAADGIHCLGSCTIKNVWWQDVGEDAATLKGSSSSQVMTIDCGGAMLAADKVLQADGPGTMNISNFYVQTFGKLYRSCGNCGTQPTRHVVMNGISALGGSILAGVNSNYNDTATFSNILVQPGIIICERFTGNTSGAEPPVVGSGADGKNCIYQPTDIHNF